MSFLSVSSLQKFHQHQLVLDIPSLNIGPHQSVAICGATGSGKSTLLKIIAGLVQPSKGVVFFNNERVIGPEEQLIPGHPKIAYLSQHFELRNHYKVIEELEATCKVEPEEATIIYQITKIDHLLHKWSNELSGGERQRIVFAKQLLKKPALFLLDEPFSNLDLHHKSIIKKIIRQAQQQLGIQFILVTHEPADILSWAERLIVLQQGKCVQDDLTQNIYKHPVNEYVAGLLGEYTLLKQIGFTKIVRPENFKIHTYPSSQTVKVKIVKIEYFGFYQMIHAESDDQCFLIRDYFTQLKNVGDTIWISC